MKNKKKIKKITKHFIKFTISMCYRKGLLWDLIFFGTIVDKDLL